jgi:small subunit ribosomal protein S17
MTEQTEKVIAKREGVVASNKMDKTVIVEVETLTRHRLYGRVLRRTTRHKAHDETNECGIGDRVIIQACRPLSKEKSWRVVQILSRAK